MGAVTLAADLECWTTPKSPWLFCIRDNFRMFYAPNHIRIFPQTHMLKLDIFEEWHPVPKYETRENVSPWQKQTVNGLELW